MTSRKHYGKQTGQAVTQALPSPAGGVRLETFVPWTLVRRGLKKQIITPLDAPQEFLAEARQERAAQAAAQDSALMRALGLAHHWQRLLDEERVASVAEIAKAEGMDVTQVRRVMRLTLLAPEVIERLMNSPDAVLEKVMRRTWPSIWIKQRTLLLPDRAAEEAIRYAEGYAEESAGERTPTKEAEGRAPGAVSRDSSTARW